MTPGMALCATQRVMISSQTSTYYGQFGAITDAFAGSRTYLVRLDATGAALAFGASEVVPAPAGNRKQER